MMEDKNYVVDIKEEIIEYNPVSGNILNYIVIVEEATNDLKSFYDIWPNKDRSIANLEFFSNEKLFYFLFKTCEAISYLHSNHVYYGDMKEANILIFRDYSIKIGDFGISIKCDPSIDPNEPYYELKGGTNGYMNQTVIASFESGDLLSKNDLF
mmetsp:Transcript_7077/g.5329  ORF Transcript_7077/g.5329 Transcript_7077/m.5329 type:complete len:154 (+) Transcript_7077:609-1070(+)